jgi:hypothetical protein
MVWALSELLENLGNNYRLRNVATILVLTNGLMVSFGADVL